jgi:short-subunit dehydrogenase
MNIVITGASSGIGYETTKALARETPCRIMAIARRLDLLKNLRQDCKGTGSEVIPVSFDFNSGSFSNLKSEINRQFQKIDILINNAAVLRKNSIEAFTEDEIFEMVKVNFLSTVFLSQICIPFMNNAHIVNIGSMSGFQGSQKFPGLSIYGSLKSAIASFTESLAVELLPRNISVNCLALGAVQTSMFDSAFENAKAPLLPEDIAKYIAHFSLSGNKYYNGKVLPVAISNP